jgi:SAM-dependent methyltransferase
VDGEFDRAKSDSFAERMLGLLNDGFLIFLVSIGHRLRLFDLIANLPPSTSEEIAREAGLHERYVREWLAAMVCGRIVEFDADRGTYHLPREHAASLTRNAGSANLAMFTQYAAVVGKVEDLLVEAFRTGRGVPYSAYSRMQELHREESMLTLDGVLLEEIVPLADGLDERLVSGVDVMELGCGAGHAMNLLASRYPASRFTGYDLSESGIELARAEAATVGAANVRFEVQDVARLERSPRFDVVTAFDAIHDQARPAEVLRCVYDVLRSGGLFLMFDTGASKDLATNRDHPLGAFLYSASTTYCMSVSLAYGGPGLGTMWSSDSAIEMLREAGFRDVALKTLANDPVHGVFLGRKP